MTKVKICGITNLEDALDAVKFGADELGFNFYKKSPRYIHPEDARDIINQLPGDLVSVGVFVNEELEKIVETSEIASLNTIQLHGDEPFAFIDDVRSKTGLTIIKALRVSHNFDPEDASGYACDAILLDAYSPKEHGGTGHAFDWEIAKMVSTLVPTLYLAGGLSPENVGNAIRNVRPYAVDACSKLEFKPGKKDADKVLRFILAAKEEL